MLQNHSCKNQGYQNIVIICQSFVSMSPSTDGSVWIGSAVLNETSVPYKDHIHVAFQSINKPYSWHYDDVTMGAIASQITSLAIVYSAVYSDADQRKHEGSASLAIVWGIHRDRWIPRTKGQLRGKCFHLMTSSWEFGRSPTRWYLCYLCFRFLVAMVTKENGPLVLT